MWRVLGALFMPGNRPVIAVLAVIDDDDYVLTSLDNLLSSAGYVVQSYSAAEQFLATRPFGNVDCIISDIMMPGMSGLDLLRAVHAEAPSLPVILITAHGTEQTVSSALSMGAVSVFIKPFEGAAMLKAVRDAIGPQRK